MSRNRFALEVDPLQVAVPGGAVVGRIVALENMSPDIVELAAVHGRTRIKPTHISVPIEHDLAVGHSVPFAVPISPLAVPSFRTDRFEHEFTLAAALKSARVRSRTEETFVVYPPATNSAPPAEVASDQIVTHRRQWERRQPIQTAKVKPAWPMWATFLSMVALITMVVISVVSSPRARFVGVAAFVLPALVLVCFWHASDRSRRRAAQRLKVVRVSERVVTSGDVLAEIDNLSGVPVMAGLRCVAFSHRDGNTEATVDWETLYEEWQTLRPGSTSLSLAVPRSIPPSFVGHLEGVIWEVRVAQISDGLPDLRNSAGAPVFVTHLGPLSR